MATDERRARREQVVREHMESENRQEFDATLRTFSHPRYELIPTGQVFDGVDEVSKYYADSRAIVPDQRNELIALHHADDVVIVEFWLRGTPSGRPFECRMCAMFFFDDDDLMTCERVYYDAATIANQVSGAA
ncbi:MAG TPA: nuclear transport factor 2 family protein [Acidimicrobiia bacterium]|nr:nuclear transport factor 2 family protein [Acidimicrobiia bacterium]